MDSPVMAPCYFMQKQSLHLSHCSQGSLLLLPPASCLHGSKEIACPVHRSTRCKQQGIRLELELGLLFIVQFPSLEQSLCRPSSC